jgi:mono/diheme cytochrome c family protein
VIRSMLTALRRTSALMMAAALLFGVTTPGAVRSDDAGVARRQHDVARGKYLVTIAGCNDCHTPLKVGPNGAERDMNRMLSGHPEKLAMPPSPTLVQGPWQVTVAETFTAWSGPWGVSFTANLTPDTETGLGRWTLRNFKDTIRSGRHLGRGRLILPPMPIPMYQHMTDEDLEAIFSYLQTIPAVRNRVPEPLPSAAAMTATH